MKTYADLNEVVAKYGLKISRTEKEIEERVEEYLERHNSVAGVFKKEDFLDIIQRYLCRGPVENGLEILDTGVFLGRMGMKDNWDPSETWLLNNFVVGYDIVKSTYHVYTINFSEMLNDIDLSNPDVLKLIGQKWGSESTKKIKLRTIFNSTETRHILGACVLMRWEEIIEEINYSSGLKDFQYEILSVVEEIYAEKVLKVEVKN